ncbi:ATP-binding cassette domain-containing protein [Acaryochloris sp. IP29b_bin.137]|uniref:ABC transporter ATP-binding protein n=1 Tax=Acaryochloris sp. IP29b_bin.137 TaxID=2969217 RepID=UPI00262C73AC|nr:ATP-binding cassette domain-containing protein [Acaryochloris sp. IP29b_bin.137]
MVAIYIDHLYKSFTFSRGWGKHRKQTNVVAVDRISLNIPCGQAIAFIGPNGAGKSTTIKMLTGILHPTAGKAMVLGYVPWKDRQSLARRIGVVFGQRSQLWYHLPPRDTLELLARIYDLEPKVFRQRRDSLVERFGLNEFWSTPVRKLSLGQRMRAEVAASLLHEPQILFLDEPTIGLDVLAQQKLRNLICEWNQQEGTTVFLTSHDTGDIERVAQRVVVINHGQIMLDAPVSELRSRYLNEKILSVKFHTPIYEFPTLQGVRQLEVMDFGLKLEINTRLIPIEQVISQILQIGSVADVAIEDPPLDAVIAHIYNQPASEGLSL